MNHRPFEDWLLADQPLNPEQKRELQTHLRDCTACTALAEVNLALRSARTVVPAPGFSSRWQARLAVEHKLQRRRQAIGSSILALGGVGLLVWIATPFVMAFLASPAEWITNWISYMLFLLTSVRALSEAASVIMRVLPEVVPPYIWLVAVSALAGAALLGSISIWRVTRYPLRT